MTSEDDVPITFSWSPPTLEALAERLSSTKADMAEGRKDLKRWEAATAGFLYHLKASTCDKPNSIVDVNRELNLPVRVTWFTSEPIKCIGFNPDHTRIADPVRDCVRRPESNEVWACSHPMLWGRRNVWQCFKDDLSLVPLRSIQPLGLKRTARARATAGY